MTFMLTLPGSDRQHQGNLHNLPLGPRAADMTVAVDCSNSVH